VIPLVDLVAQYNTIKPEIDAAVQQVLASGKFILGPNVSAFEQEAAAYLGVKHAVGVASGTDALVIALRAAGVGPGDEVIAPAYSFFGTAGAVLTVGARPVFVDVNPQTYLIDVAQVEAAIGPHSRAILPVHLYGQPADMDELRALAVKHGLKLIEDNAQGFGAVYKGRKTGSLGDLGCLSFFPTKNLGGYGDGGMVTTNDDALAEKVRMLRAHGWKKKYFPEMLGYNSRLDELQAAILRVKLNYVDGWNERRRELAHRYTHCLAEIGLAGPVEAPERSHVYHLYIVSLPERERIQHELKESGVACEVYYPQPLHLAEPCRNLGGHLRGSLPVSEYASQHTLALPLYPELSEDQLSQVVEAVETAMRG
jgi:dTDP-4-amino-4,6-dideoxygalactose transaminase